MTMKEGPFKNILENVHSTFIVQGTVAGRFLVVAEAGKTRWYRDECQPAEAKRPSMGACLLITFKLISSQKATSQTL